MAQAEGWGIPGALPTRDHNPLDLRHAPHAEHSPEAPNAIGQEPSDDAGWADADRQVERWRDRGLTLGAALDLQLGIVRDSLGNVIGNPDNNNWREYQSIVCDGLQLPREASMTAALEIAAV